jgi:predicted AAA+ superfamily ATPase
MAEFDLARGTILTFDQEDEIKVMGKTIVLMPVWKWLLEEYTS